MTVTFYSHPSTSLLFSLSEEDCKRFDPKTLKWTPMSRYVFSSHFEFECFEISSKEAQEKIDALQSTINKTKLAANIKAVTVYAPPARAIIPFKAALPPAAHSSLKTTEAMLKLLRTIAMIKRVAR